MWARFGLFWLSLVVCTSTFAEGWLSRSRRRQSVCYDGWGCFSRSAPFTNTGKLPEGPEQLGVRFFLHTRDHSLHERTLLELDWSDEDIDEVVDVTKDTRVIVHGFLDSGEEPWVLNMVQELLIKADQNVLVIDWGRGARSFDYLQVAANTRLVGKMVAAMLEKWVRVGADPSTFHLIGASLGAHISSYVGTHLPGIGRITGLDPAAPGFHNTDPVVRLDPTDAIFVDVIHTNAVPIFQMDLQNIMGCSHLRAVSYFIDSINSQCAMSATPCSFPHILRRRNPCRHHAHQHQCDDCVTMGYDVDLNASPGVYYVRTHEEAPFCIASVEEDGGHRGWRGLFD